MHRSLLAGLVFTILSCTASGQAPFSDTSSIAPLPDNGFLRSPAATSLLPPPGIAADIQSATPAPVQPPSASLPPRPDPQAKQTKRILDIIPNFHAVSANTKLPPLSAKSKFLLATKDSFDYSAFIFAGLLAGGSMMENSYPEFHEGAEAYGRYYWHTFTDQAVGNYFTEGIVPSLTHEDPRFYTLGSGNFFRRAGYAASRLFITRTDSNGRSFNFSEIVGNGAASGVADLYYPSQERTWTKTGQRWILQLGFDGVFNIFEEFWPDIRHDLFRQSN